jgi:hypothetical protein
MPSIVLRLPSGVEMPINLDYEKQLAGFLHARLPSEDILFARHQPRPPINPLTCDNSPEILTPPYPPLPPVEVGELQWPTGASRYGRALYLVDGPTMRAIAIECFGWVDPEPPGLGDPPVDNINLEIPSLWGRKLYQLEVAIFGEQLFRAKMFCLPPYRVPGTAMNLFLLPLVDRRFYDLGGVHPPTETAPESIDTLIDDLAGEMDFQLTISKDAIPADYGTKVDERLYNTTVPQPASNLLDVAALSLGMRVVLEPSTNAYRMINAENSSNRRDSRLGYNVSVIEGETFVEGETSAMLVAGGKRGRAALPPRLSVWVIKDGQPFERLSDPFTDGATVGVPNYPVWTTWAETASNTVATDAFVEQLSSDMAAWSNSGGQYCFVGAIQYQPCGFDDYFSIQFLEVQSDGGELEPLLRSRVYELPPLFGPAVFLVGGDLEECGGGKWFILAEDIESTTDEEVYVWFGKLETGVAPIRDSAAVDPVLLTNVGYCLSPVGKLARAGYYGRMQRDGDKWIPTSTYGCLTSCVTAEGADLPAPEFTDATVDAEYTFTIEVTGDVTDVEVENLPAGLTFNAETLTITGTPTTAGYKWVTVTGTSGTCVLTKLAKLTVLEPPPEE